MDAVPEDRYQIIETLRIPSWQSITGGELQCLRALGVSGRVFMSGAFTAMANLRRWTWTTWSPSLLLSPSTGFLAWKHCI